MYIIMVVGLAVLAAIDLVVGVSNDAVNFLNSAIGSKAIPIKKIMVIASLGVLAGALSSSGMMEVARKGIFVPGQFYFNEIMYIFMAVMITDILLLDIFNSLGMPTSTTVSIVFELLGAAVIIAIIKINHNDAETIGDIWNYINYEKAIMIIAGIILSVIVAFSIGALVQFVSRLVYSFNFNSRPTYINALFGGFAITAITYFIVVKGLKGTAYYGDVKHLIEGNNSIIIGAGFAVWTVLSYLLISLLKVDILKLIIAIGTFSLAMAFAGNDLVNFIGVPIAAWNSYEAWHVSGIAPDMFSMEILAKKVPSNTFLLIVAGAIMVVTLWFSKKARAVIETGVNLSRQGEGHEKFTPNSASRGMVRAGIVVNNVLVKIIPQTTLNYINTKFEKPELDYSVTKAQDLPAFDMVRASINLVVAGILISIGTSLKLPLSTTYVTFMVAMGTSLADRAWGRESAVYRIAGVLSVVGGWFLTAIVAFTASAFVAYIIYLGTIYAVVVLLVLVLGIVSRGLFIKSEVKEVEAEEKITSTKDIEALNTINDVIENSSEKVLQVTKRVNKLYQNIIISLANYDLEGLKKNDKQVKKLYTEIDGLKSDVFYFIKSLDESSVDASKFYVEVIDYLQDVVQSVEYISKIAFKHVNNNHKKLKKVQTEKLNETLEDLVTVFEQMENFFNKKDLSLIAEILETKAVFSGKLSNSIQEQIERIRTTETSAKNSTLYFGILMETKDMLTELINLSEHYQGFYDEKKMIS